MISGRRRASAGRQPAPVEPGNGPAPARRGRWKLTLLLLVAGNLGLQLTAARLIKEASLLPASEILAIALLMAVVLVLAFGRFLF